MGGCREDQTKKRSTGCKRIKKQRSTDKVKKDVEAYVYNKLDEVGEKKMMYKMA